MSDWQPVSLTPEQIAELLKPKETVATVPQAGPLRWFDKEMRCASRGCSSPTFAKVNGTPRCMMHALRELNEMLTRLMIRPDEGDAV
jgi:hypothetical protein